MAQTSGSTYSGIRAVVHVFPALFIRRCSGTGWRGILMYFLMPLLVACGSSGGNSGAPTFAKSYGGDFSDGVAAAIATSDGGYALVGKYGVDEDDHHSLPWFIKLDRNGDIQWHQTVNPEQPGASLGLAVDEPVFKPTSDGGFCMAGRVPGVAGDPGDIYVSRLDSQLNILWETRFDSGGWNGYEIVAAGNRGAFSYDVPVAVVESGNNSCIVAATSFAHLRNITGHGIRSDDSSVVINGNGVFLNARSLVLASADVSGLR